MKALSHPARLAILEILREGEQCVCHMEATLGLRQAYISQQLMILKNAGILEARRDGLNLYYRVINAGVFNILDSLSAATGVSVPRPVHKHADIACPCPKCSTSAGPALLQISLLDTP
jgi:ArsR family transcriptional regulator